jgi:putative ABC transport system substrate-binding protein
VRRALLLTVVVVSALAVSPIPIVFETLGDAERHRLPTVYEHRRFADLGGLASYGPPADERFKQVAEYVDRILRGARPADLPIQRPTRVELVLNVRTAKALGLSFPQSVLVQASELIQ